MRVIGFDPGLQRTGWGVVEVAGSKLVHVANGVCSSGEGTLAERLCRLHRLLVAVVRTQHPDVAAVEHTFVNKDAAGTLKLGQARAMALLAPAQAGMEVAEYAPNAVKKAVVGVGHAQKDQVAHMVRHLLPGARIDGPDAADALAVAICHAWTAGAEQRRRRAVMGRR
ncbi:MAG: crossover junction endodeoxyribonuclease RuvC [Pseudomonadota bacterium]